MMMMMMMTIIMPVVITVQHVEKQGVKGETCSRVCCLHPISDLG